MNKSITISSFAARVINALKLNIDEILTLGIVTGLMFMSSFNYRYAQGSSIFFSVVVGTLFAYIQRIWRGTKLFRQHTYINVCTKYGFVFGWYSSHALRGLYYAVLCFFYGVIMSPRAPIQPYLWAFSILAVLAISFSVFTAWVLLRLYPWRDVDGRRIISRSKGQLYMWNESLQTFQIVVGYWCVAEKGIIRYKLPFDSLVINATVRAYRCRFAPYKI